MPFLKVPSPFFQGLYSYFLFVVWGFAFIFFCLGFGVLLESPWFGKGMVDASAQNGLA